MSAVEFDQLIATEAQPDINEVFNFAGNQGIELTGSETLALHGLVHNRITEEVFAQSMTNERGAFLLGITYGLRAKFDLATAD
jgi:hypothetical protein